MASPSGYFPSNRRLPSSHRARDRNRDSLDDEYSYSNYNDDGEYISAADDDGVSPRSASRAARPGRARSPDPELGLLRPPSSRARAQQQPAAATGRAGGQEVSEKPLAEERRRVVRVVPPRARSVPAWVKISRDGSNPPSTPPPPNPTNDRTSRWDRHLRTPPTPLPPLPRTLVPPTYLTTHFGSLATPWHTPPPTTSSSRPPKPRPPPLARLQAQLMYSPLVPLLIRAIVFGFSVVALALGASIRHFTRRDERARAAQGHAEGVPKGPSALMAIVVDAVALVYLLYVTYDELRGKPLGLRSPFAKMRLILLDLIFIIFDSANLSLAFEALSDVRESCEAAHIEGEFVPASRPVCARQKALASVLLVALIAWVVNFSLGIFRFIARVSGSTRNT